MKKLSLIFFAFLLNASYLQAQEISISKKVTDAEDEPISGLEALMSFNFVGSKSTLNNFTPQIYYNWSKSYKANFLRGGFQVGPYTSSQIDVTKSLTYLPGLMTPGNFGVIMNHYFQIGQHSHKLYVSPVNLGMKILAGFADSSKTVIQTNIRPSLTYEYANLFMFSIQHTYAWHNITSDSKKNFEYIFGTKKTAVKYLTVTIQTKVGDIGNKNRSAENPILPTYFIMQWRNFIEGNEKLTALPNKKFLTFGFKVGLDIKNGTPAK